MLKISMKYDKRILLCRLNGNLNKNTSKRLIDLIENIIDTKRIRYMIINIANLLDIDDYGTNSLLRVKKYIDDKKGHLLILNNNNLLNTRLVALDILNING